MASSALLRPSHETLTSSALPLASSTSRRPLRTLLYLRVAGSHEQDTRFDDRLFRTKAPKRLKPGTLVAIHPLLNETICIFTDKKPVTYADIDRNSERTAFDYPAAEEFATNPACSVMLVHLNTSKALPVTDRNGVKVKRLLQRLSWYWNAKPPLDIRYTVASQLELDPEKVGWIDTLGDRCGWAGWEFGKVEDDGSVHLHANWYDS